MGSIKEKIQGKIPGKIKRKEVTTDTAAGVTSNLAKEESGKAGFFSVATAKRLAKKHIAAIIAVAVIGAGAGTVYGALQAQVEDLGENPVYGESEAKTQVLLEGKGYSLDKNQKKDYDLPQKLEKKKDNKLNKYNPITPRVYPNYSSGTYRFSGIRSSSYNSNKFKPSVTTNLRKLTKGETFAAGEKITFWVEGKTYSKANIKTKYYTVRSNGKKVEANESDSDTHAEYTITVPNPTKRNYFYVRVAVRDPLRKVTTPKAYKIYIKGGTKTKDKTDDTTDTTTAIAKVTNTGTVTIWEDGSCVIKVGTEEISLDTSEVVIIGKYAPQAGDEVTIEYDKNKKKLLSIKLKNRPTTEASKPTDSTGSSDSTDSTDTTDPTGPTEPTEETDSDDD